QEAVVGTELEAVEIEAPLGQRLQVGRGAHGRRRPLDALDLHHRPAGAHLDHRVDVAVLQDEDALAAHPNGPRSPDGSLTGRTRTILVPGRPSSSDTVPSREA